MSPAANFGAAIDSLSNANGGNGVVVLIDEYDAPVSHALDDLAKAEAIRSRMGAFFSMMKTRTGAIRFLMMTGVSKFTKMSVFSCLNNIVEISMEDVQANGRADIVASHVNGVFIFELKVGEPVDRAFSQIREKNYAAPYLASGLPIHLIGLSFDPETRQRVDAAAEKFN